MNLTDMSVPHQCFTDYVGKKNFLNVPLLCINFNSSQEVRIFLSICTFDETDERHMNRYSWILQ